LRVRQRHVAKGEPRAHLGSFGHDDLGFVEHPRRIRQPGGAGAEQLTGDVLFYLKLLAEDDGTVTSVELRAVRDQTHSGKM